MKNTSNLSGQVCFITGGGRGIGRRIAEQLAESGAAVAIAARTAAELNETAVHIHNLGGICRAYKLDVTDPSAVVRITAQIYEDLGQITLLINNAGIGSGGAVSWESDPNKWWRVFEVNVRGVFNCTHAVLKPMVDAGEGRIINIGSYAGVNPAPMASAYGASKAALLHFSNSVGAELENTNIKIFTISPGLVHTDMTKNVPVFKDLPATAWTSIDRAGEVCVVLASGGADNLSGRFIHVSDDDLGTLIDNAEEIIDKDLQVLRLRRFNSG